MYALAFYRLFFFFHVIAWAAHPVIFREALMELELRLQTMVHTLFYETASAKIASKLLIILLRLDKALAERPYLLSQKTPHYMSYSSRSDKRSEYSGLIRLITLKYKRLLEERQKKYE